MKITKREVDYEKKCPKGHKDVELVEYEKIDKVDELINIDPFNTRRTRKVIVYNGWCKIYCYKCRKEYYQDCYIYEYGPWRINY